MSWDSKPSYPSSAHSTVTIKATTSQCYRWGKAAKLRKMARGAFIALAVDTYCLFLDAVADAEVEYDREMHPERWRRKEGE